MRGVAGAGNVRPPPLLGVLVASPDLSVGMALTGFIANSTAIQLPNCVTQVWG